MSHPCSLNFVNQVLRFDFGVLLGIAISGLHGAFDLVRRAFGLQPVVADHLARGFLDASLGLFDPALDLVFVHDASFKKLNPASLLLTLQAVDSL